MGLESAVMCCLSGAEEGCERRTQNAYGKSETCSATCCGMLDAECRYRSLDRFRSCEGFSRPSTERWQGLQCEVVGSSRAAGVEPNPDRGLAADLEVS